MPDIKRYPIDLIACNNISKRYMYEKVLIDFIYTFEIDKCYGLRGPNGSGKSTLIKILSGFSTPSKGSILFSVKGHPVNISDVFAQVTIAAPYIELIDEMTVDELLHFHHGLRPFYSYDLAVNEVKQLPFKGILSKRISELSSGMKQRIKLILALLARASIVLLDEPGSNLDASGKDWFEQLLLRNKSNKIIIIASNEEDDRRKATEVVYLSDYK